ncbi:DMT family transporter [Martelella mediterranea]|uniref:Transporter family-2 protein n=1 Tax=Martelella mediterranea TaxID=293089 RepID=A0A4V2V4Z0_9HYPH|nr:DMT family transporter [Martelella mediterranea]TCT44541.1 transporter family-2 protein [Martelella mediterranea]
MIAAIAFAVVAGVLVGISRQVNGRLSLSTSPMVSSFFNHFVGFIAMCIVALAVGGLIPQTLSDIPVYAYLGGPVGVIFVAAGSWVIPKIGAVNTAVLIIGGQMVAGVLMDLAEGAGGDSWLRYAGLALILAGILLAQQRKAG